MAPSGVKVSEICRSFPGGLLFPLTEGELAWSDNLRAVLYVVAMVYCFLGVSMVADTFVGAIDVITSRRRRLLTKSGQLRTEPVWNEVVANLSLMALGSSAPEIFLSVIDLFRQNMHAGDLGGATIIGSAAFNLLVIIAVCIVCIPDGEVRVIGCLQVYYVTVVFAVLAYLWAMVVLVLHTPDVIDIAEAVLTLAMMPLLLYVSYKVDTGLLDRLVGCLPWSIQQRLSAMGPPTSGPESQSDAVEAVASRSSWGCNSNSTTQSTNSHSKQAQLGRKPTVAMQKSVLLKKLTASRARLKDSARPARRWTSEQDDALTAADSHNAVKDDQVMVELLAESQGHSCSLPSKPVLMVRVGRYMGAIEVEYSVAVCSGSGQLSPRAPDHVGTAVLNAEEEKAAIQVEPPEPGQDFTVRLLSARAVEEPKVRAMVGPLSTTRVRAMGDATGVLAWASPSTIVRPEQGRKPTFCTATIVRKGGCVGELKCQWRMQGLDTVPDLDYVDAKGALHFAEGITEQIVEFMVLPKRRGRVSDYLMLVLEPLEDEEGSLLIFDEEQDGCGMSAYMVVKIKVDTDGAVITVGARLLRRLDGLFNLEAIRKGNSDWLQQWPEAVFCGGSWEEQREASLSDWFFHLFALPWKLLFTLVPPAVYGGGWVCFGACLFWIGVVTAALADLAELFGCVAGIPDFVTAITLVALGTSMPDLFASKSAATGDDTADASIANVTGSNAVNIFLGLGLPWTAGSIYWAVTGPTAAWKQRYPDIALKYPGQAVFVLKAGDLGFGVLAFSAASLVSLFMLFFRRNRLGAELGGPFWPKVLSATAFVTLWFAYIIAASWRSLRGSGSSIREDIQIFTPLLAACFVAVVVAMTSILFHRPVVESKRSSDAEAGMGELSTIAEGDPVVEAGGSSRSVALGARKPPPPLPEELDRPCVPDILVKKFRSPAALAVL